MLYIEAPVGVGFSYNSNGDYKCSDDRTALENMEAVEAFFQDFPEFKNSLYVNYELCKGSVKSSRGNSSVKLLEYSIHIEWSIKKSQSSSIYNTIILIITHLSGQPLN